QIAFDFINYLNEINYDSHSVTTYGTAINFFTNIELEDLFEWLLTAPRLLQSGYVLNQLFDLQNTDRSQEVISLHTSGTIDKERLDSIYWVTHSISSKTSLGLCKYLCEKFPN